MDNRHHSKYACISQPELRLHIRWHRWLGSTSKHQSLFELHANKKQLRMVSGWLAIHEDEVYAAWNDTVRGIALAHIEGEWGAMYEVDGIVYGSEPAEDMHVTNVRDTGDFIILVTFSSGETRLVDCTEHFSLPAFACLADKDAFATLEIRHGVLTWLDGKVDIAPEGLYARCPRAPRTTLPMLAGGAQRSSAVFCDRFSQSFNRPPFSRTLVSYIIEQACRRGKAPASALYTPRPKQERCVMTNTNTTPSTKQGVIVLLVTIALVAGFIPTHALAEATAAGDDATPTFAEEMEAEEPHGNKGPSKSTPSGNELQPPDAGLITQDDGQSDDPEHTHDWGEWTLSKAPNCMEPGEEERVCKDDPTHKDTQPVAIDADAHDWSMHFI